MSKIAVESLGGGFFAALSKDHRFGTDAFLLADFAAAHGAQAIVRGVRGVSDFDGEYQMAQINRGLRPGLESLLLPASPEYQHFSSSMAREMIRYRQPLEKYLPPAIIPLVEELRKREEEHHGR